MSDNGSCYIGHDYAEALHQLGLKHQRTRPHRPRTNGKAERLIQTLLNEWAYHDLRKRTRTSLRSLSTSSATTTSDHTAASATNRQRHG